jgi:putative transposase
MPGIWMDPNVSSGVAALPWNRWQPSCGISGSFDVESVAGFAWNTQAVQEMWRSPSRPMAQTAFETFSRMYGAKYPKAVDSVASDLDELLTFYDFPAEHWQHVRTTNPIESTFATVRLRTAKTRGCLSRHTILTMVFKLGQSAEKGWLRLRGYRRLSAVMRGVTFVDGVEEEEGNQSRKVA